MKKALLFLCLIAAWAFAWDFPTPDKKRVSISDVPNWGDKGFSLEVWARPDSADGGYVVLMRGAFGYPKLLDDGSGFDAYIVSNDGKNASSRIYKPLENGKFHHYVLSCTPTSNTLYADGKAMRTNKANGIPKYVPDTPILVGNSIGWCKKNFEGSVGLVRVYNRALATKEIQEHFELLKGGKPLPDDTTAIVDEDKRFGDKKQIPQDLGQKVTKVLDNTIADGKLHERSRHLAGYDDYWTPVVDFEDMTGWKVTYVSGEVEPRIRLSRELPLWGKHVLRCEFRQGVAPNPKAKVVLEPPKPIRIPSDFDAVAIWRFAMRYGQPRPALAFSVQWRDASGKVHDSGRLGGMLETGWGLKMNPLPETMKAGSELLSITFTGFNEPKRVVYLDNLHFYQRSRKPLPADAQIPTYESLGVPNRKETVQPTAAEPGDVALKQVAPKHWRFTSTGRNTGKKLIYDVKAASGTLSDIEVIWNGRTFTPMQGGGFHWATNAAYPVTPESLIAPNSPRIKASLKKATAKDNSLLLAWEYLIDGKVRRQATWSMTVRNQTLVMDLCGDPGEKVGNVGEFQFGAITGITGKVVEIPYLTWGRWIHPSNPPGIFAADNCYVFALLDWYNSDASGLFGQSSATPGGHFELRADTADHRWVADKDAKDPTNVLRDYSVINGGSYYWPTTAGVRNPARERVMLTVADKLENVLPNIPHNPNPDLKVTRDDVWATRMWYANKMMPDYFDQELAMWKECRDYGMEKINVRLHGNINRVYWPMHYGDPSTFIRSFTTPVIGGDDALAKFFADMKGLGFRIGIYTDHMLLSAVAREAWDEDMMNQGPNGGWLYSSGNTNQTKTSRLVALQKKWNGLYREKFGPNCAYLDQVTCPPCWRYTDYDSRAPGAAKFSASWRVLAESLLQERKDFGPVISEGKTHLFFAGLCDSYAQTQRMRMNIIPDFELRKIHPLSNDCGAELGWVNWKGSAGGKMDKWSYKLLAHEYAYGNIGHLGACYHGAPLNPVPGAMIRTYFLIQPMQKYFSGVKVDKILYYVNGKWAPVEEAIKAGTLSQNQVRLLYENGLEVAVNLNETENLTVNLKGTEYILPPEGFVAVTADKENIAFSALQDGKRADLCIQKGFLYCVNGAANPRLKGNGAYLLRQLSAKKQELMPAPFEAAENVQVAVTSGKVRLTRYDRGSKKLGEQQLKAADGWATLPVDKEAFKLVLEEL